MLSLRSNLRVFAIGLTMFVVEWSATQANEPTGMRQLKGRHITIFTDLPADPQTDELPRVFDLAIPQWAEYFDVDGEQWADWHVNAFLMRNERRFRDQGLLPDDLPPFLHGYQRGNACWVREQPSAYYQRHLLLHEGTHAFMQRALGGAGAAWYMEGVAELLATHTWHEGRLQLNVFPSSRESVPFWGRIKLVKEAVALGQPRSLRSVFELQGSEFRRVRAYAWSWAAVMFLDRHPRFTRRMKLLQSRVTASPADFSAWFWQQLAPDADVLNEAWQLFLSELDYGYDVAADVIDYRPVRDPAGTQQIVLQTNRGWQSTGLRLVAGRDYRVRADGRYQVLTGEENWSSEPEGVTIQYHRGFPKGMLLGALKENDATGTSPLTRPRPLGREQLLRPARDAVLFLRINEPAGMRADNRGELTVHIDAEGTTPN